MNPVNWFEIPVIDMARAKKFYEAVFGFTLTPENMGPMEMAFFPANMEEPGAAGSLSKGPGLTPSKDGTHVYFSVADIEAVLKKAEAAGGRTETPKTSIDQYGFIGAFIDTEGNLICLHSM